MKKLLVSLIAVMAIAYIFTNCSGPSVVYTGELQGRDTIVIVTQPGLIYEVRVIPNFTNIKEEQIKYFIPSLYITQVEVAAPLADLAGGSYVFTPRQDTIHSFTLIKNGMKQTVLCSEADAQLDPCETGMIIIKCNDDVDNITVNCDEQTE